MKHSPHTSPAFLLAVLLLGGAWLAYIVGSDLTPNQVPVNPLSRLAPLSPQSQLAQVSGSSCTTGDLTCGLVGWWKFDEGSGTTAADSSGSGNSGTLTGSALPTWTTGQIGGALSFNGSTQYVDAPPSSSLNNMGPLTYSAWVYPSAINASQTIFDKHGKTFYLENYYSGGDNFDFSVQATGVNVNYKCNNAVFANRWSLVSVTWNGIVGTGAAVTGYVNGVPCANGSLNSSSGTAGDDSSYHADIGTVSGTHSKYFDGSIDDVRVYNRVLSAAEVATLYNDGLSGGGTGTGSTGSTASTGSTSTTSTGSTGSASTGSTGTQNSVSTGPTTYYIDYVGGSDSNSGTSPSQAWQHSPGDPNAIGNPKSVALEPGDTIAFKGGVVYQFPTSGGYIAAEASGSSGSPITYISGNLLSTPWPDASSRAVIDGTNSSYSETGADNGIVSLGSYSWLVVDGFEIRNSQPFTNVNQMAYSGGITWGGSAPGSGNITIKDNYIHNLTVDGIYIRGRWDLAQSDQVPANFDIADNTIEWTNGHGIFVRWGVNNAVIEGNMIDLSGVDFEHSGGDIAADNIFLEGGANQGGGSMQYNNVIRNNILKKSEESLGYPVNKSNVFISDQNNLNIYGNLFTGQPQVANMDDAGIIQGMNVFNNVFTGSIYTFQGPISFHTDQGATTPFSNIKILDNTFVDSPASGGGDLGFNIGVGTNITILNNIIDGNPESGNFAKFGYQINVLFNTGIVDYTTLQINNNVYNSAMTTPFYLNGSYYKLSGWKPALQSLGVSGYDSNSSYGAASFVDRSGGDFHLASNDTLARGQGINLSAYCSSIPALCTDKDGKPRPSTGPWDIGAYQYSSTPINNNPPSPIPTDSPTPTPSATPVTSSSSGSAPTPPTTSGGVTVASAGGGIVGGGGTVGGGGGGGGASITTGANSGASNSPATNSPTKPCTSSSSTIPASALSLTIGTRGQAVINLQTFLVITGYLQRQYITGYFGPLTKASLTSYQSAHPSNTCASTTLQPSHPTTLPQFTRSLKLGMIGNDVKNLQIFLNTHGFTVSQSGPGSSGHETTYFGPATFRALIRFQNAYANQILAPYGLSQGTGFFGPSTIKEANSLI